MVGVVCRIDLERVEHVSIHSMAMEGCGDKKEFGASRKDVGRSALA